MQHESLQDSTGGSLIAIGAAPGSTPEHTPILAKAAIDTAFAQKASPVWRGIEHGVELLKQGAIWRIGNGQNMRIWPGATSKSLPASLALASGGCLT